MRFSVINRFALFVTAMLMLFVFCGIGCKGEGPVPSAYQFNAAIATMSGTYVSNVIPIHYYISISSPRQGTIAIPSGYADVYSIVEYSTNGGVKYNLCHNTQGNPGDYFSFTEAPSTFDSTFNWDVDGDLGPNVNVAACMIRVRVFFAGDDPCSKAPQDVEKSGTFAIALGAGDVCGNPPAITSEGVPDATDGDVYSYQFESTGGYGNLTWSLTQPINEGVVSGLTFSPDGLLSGTPVLHQYQDVGVSITLDVWITDSCPTGARQDSQVYTLRINPQEIVCDPLNITTTSLPDATEEDESYNALLHAAGGYGNLSWTITMGALPDDLNLNSATGVISGSVAAETAGDYPITFLVTDSCPNPQTDSVSLVLHIEAAAAECAAGPDITTTSPLPDGTQSQPYDVQLAATGGEGALVWSYTGTLPLGLQIGTDGHITGTPTEAGDFNPTIRVTDSCWTTPQYDEMPFDLHIEAAVACADPPEITTTELDVAYQGLPYSMQLVATDGEGNLTWQIINGNLPDSLTMGSDGLISGDVDCGTVNDYSITVQVSDSCEVPGTQSDQQVYILTVSQVDCSPAPDINDSQTVQDAITYVPYSYGFQYTGGYGTLSWEMTAGTLPPGLTLDTSTGIITGVPDPGSEGNYYDMEVTVTDSCPCNPQSDAFGFWMHVDAGNTCLGIIPEAHTFCLSCPQIIMYENTENVELYLLTDTLQNPPAEIEIDINYDPALGYIDPANVTAGPAVGGTFNASGGSGTITITYTGPDLIGPIVFANLPVTNINYDTMAMMDVTISVTTIKDSGTNDLMVLTVPCTIVMQPPS